MSSLHSAAIADLQGEVLILRTLFSSLTKALVIEGHLTADGIDAIENTARYTATICNFRDEDRRAQEFKLLDTSFEEIRGFLPNGS